MSGIVFGIRIPGVRDARIRNVAGEERSMPKSSSRVLALALFALALTVLITAAAAGAGKRERHAAHGAVKHAKAGYQDPDASIKRRVNDLLSPMTLEEKVGQMGQINAWVLMGNPGDPWDRAPLNPDLMANVLDTNHIGSILSGGGAWPPVGNDGKAWAEMTNAIQRFALDHSRLGIPIIYGVDGVHGHNNLFDATMVPHQIGLGATFDSALAARLGQSTARAVRATGVVWDFAPVFDTE